MLQTRLLDQFRTIHDILTKLEDMRHGKRNELPTIYYEQIEMLDLQKKVQRKSVEFVHVATQGVE